MPKDLPSISKTAKRNRSKARQIREQAPARATFTLNTTPASYRSAGVDIDYDYTEYTKVVEEIKVAKAPAAAKAPAEATYKSAGVSFDYDESEPTQVVEEIKHAKPAKAKAPAVPAHHSGEIKEEKEAFTYKAPDSYVAPEVVQIEEEKVEEEPVVEIKEEAVTESASPMEVLAEKVASITPKKKEKKQLSEEALYEEKILALESRIERMSRQMSEMSSTLVYNLGAGSPGSGEVRINRMDDVAGVASLQDGDALVWDTELQKWIPGSASGAGDLSEINKNLTTLFNKFASLDARIHGWVDAERQYLELEANTGATSPRPVFVDESVEVIDTVADGDTTTFAVTIEAGRNVYELDGVPQPTVQLPRGDIIIFDLSALTSTQANEFDIFINGVILPDSAGCVRSYPNSITVNTGLIDSNLTKLYYKNRVTRGMGWLIVITDN